MNKKVIVLVLVIIASGALYFSLNFRNNPSFAWKGNGAYKVKLTTSLGSDNYTLRTDLFFKRLQNNSNKLLYHVFFKDMSLYVNGESLTIDTKLVESIIVPVEFGEDGRILSGNIPEFIGFDLVSLMKTAIYTPEIVLAQPEYKSSYEGRKYRFSEKGKKIERQTFSSDKSSFSSSLFTAELSDTFWLKSFSGSESGKTQGYEFSYSASYEAIKYEDNPFAAESEDDIAAVAGRVYDNFRNYEQPVLTRRTSADNELLLASFMNLANDNNSSFFDMAELLRANPSMMELIPDILKKYDETEDVKARMLIGILEYIGTPKAQEILSNIMEDTQQSETSRIRAIVALNGVELPTDKTIERLIYHSLIRSDDKEIFLADTATLALGAAASKLKEGGSETYEQVKSEMLLNLQAETIPADTSLLAIGNMQDPELYDTVTPYLSSDDVFEKRAAITAARKLDEEKFEQDAESILTNEINASVRMRVYEELNNIPTGNSVDLVISNMHSESNSEVRQKMLLYLSNNVHNSKASETLKDMLENNQINSPQDRIMVRQALRKIK